MKDQSYQLLEVANGKPIKLWTEGVPVENEARAQLMNTAKMPFIFKHLAVMPDVHLGKGSTIGSVIPTVGAIIPAAVGVDIGCGMMAVKTPFKSGILDGKLKELRLKIEEAIPTGFSEHKESVDESSYWEGWNEFKELHNVLCFLWLTQKGISIFKEAGPNSMLRSCYIFS